MLQPSYMLRKAPPPAAAKVFFDQRVIPALVDILGYGEAVLERLAIRVRAAPLPAVIVAALAGGVLALASPRSRPSRR